jgi:hypothetical protein
MFTFNPHKTGLVTGVFIGGLHLMWALLVLFGWAQPLINFIFTLHMLKPLIVVDEFSFVLTLGLVLLTTVIGYLLGYLSAFIWNRLYK